MVMPSPPAHLFHRADKIADRLDLRYSIKRDRDVVVVLDRHHEIHHPQ